MADGPSEDIGSHGRSNKTEESGEDLTQAVNLCSEILEGTVRNEDHAIGDKEETEALSRSVGQQDGNPLNLYLKNREEEYRNRRFIG